MQTNTESRVNLISTSDFIVQTFVMHQYKAWLNEKNLRLLDKELLVSYISGRNQYLFLVHASSNFSYETKFK